MRGYDIVGNIAIVKFARGTPASTKKKEAERLLKQNKSVTSVLEKAEKFRGRLRTLRTKWIAGVKTKEALYRENGCTFRLDVESCYFSPRLAGERLKIAKMVKRGERVLVMFGGVAPYAISIAKYAKPKKIISVELGRECNRYARENVKRNKVGYRVELMQGDVRKILPKMKEKFDRIIMARPNLKDDFLDVTFRRIKRNGIIHFYCFCGENEIGGMKIMIMKEAKEAGKKIKILKVKKAGDIGPYIYRWRIDIYIYY